MSNQFESSPTNPAASFFQDPEDDVKKKPIPKSGPVKIVLVRSGFLTRYPCVVCGGCTEKVSVLAEGPGNLRVCETCLKDRKFDHHLKKHAAELEAEAALLRQLFGRLEVPTYKQWCDAVDVNDAEYLADNCGMSMELALHVVRDRWTKATEKKVLATLGMTKKKFENKMLDSDLVLACRQLYRRRSKDLKRTFDELVEHDLDDHPAGWRQAAKLVLADWEAAEQHAAEQKNQK
jgi:hypothetical protein